MKIKHALFVSPILVSTLFLTSCGDTQQAPPVTYSYITSSSVPANAIDKNAQAQLAEAAVSVGQSMQQLSAIKMATHPHAPLAAPLSASTIGMTQVTSIEWNGPLKSVLQRIAKASGYSLNSVNQPVTPIMISVSEQNVPLATILHDVVLQAGTRATVTVYPASKTIQLVYSAS